VFRRQRQRREGSHRLIPFGQPFVADLLRQSFDLLGRYLDIGQRQECPLA
jgi:hypothetical protein